MGLDKEQIRRMAAQAGAARCGFAKAGPVGAGQAALYDAWIAAGMHGQMAYCANWAAVRRDPRQLGFAPAEDVKTVICCAFPYFNEGYEGPLALYALGDDYHYALKERMGRLAQAICEAWGGTARACVDSAPVMERYWAQQAGLGFIGVNNQLIIPGEGSYFFLAELLWTVEVEPDAPCEGDCGRCMACVKACPGHALDGQGGCDARKCLSYLTIEHRGELPAGASLHGRIYGCDECQKACPHNAAAKPTELPEFKPNGEIAALDADALRQMTPSHYKRLTTRSAMRRAPLAQLLRNLAHD